MGRGCERLLGWCNCYKI